MTQAGVAFIGGTAPLPARCRELVSPGGYVVAADSGYHTAVRAGVHVDLLIGDLDSIGDDALREIPEERVRRYPRDKDETDAELALRHLIDSGCSPITLIGGGGGRIDHLFSLLYLFHRSDHPDVWATSGGIVHAIDGVLRRRLPTGSMISFFSVGSAPARMRSTGLRWPLDSLVWEPASGAVSNVVVHEEVEVVVESGRLIAVIDVEWGDSGGG